MSKHYLVVIASLLAAVSVGCGPGTTASYDETIEMPNPTGTVAAPSEPPVLNPYRDVDWKTVLRVPSTTHMHIRTQASLDNGYRYGIRHFPISNYYPSAPYHAETRFSDFTLRQSWPAKRKGGVIQPPINWNKIITWRDELKECFRSRLPFRETPKVFKKIPADVILSPNGEHHGFTNS